MQDRDREPPSSLPNEQRPPFIQSLLDPRCYPHPVSRIRLHETHISWVLLTGEYVYKIKKPVKFSFLDFSTLENRHWYCQEELRLNTRLAPELYLGVVPLTGTPIDPGVGGDGKAFEYAVKMREFAHDLRTELIGKGQRHIDGLLEHLADQIGRFHMRAEKSGSSEEFGSPAIIHDAVMECFEEITVGDCSEDVQNQLQILQDWVQGESERLRQTFLRRKHEGFVRECHGDFHLGNIAMFQQHPCVFDALEFAPHLRWIDVLSEAAFLVMDLVRNRRKDLGYFFLNHYLEHTGDYSGLEVFRFYAVYRALVRAKVAALREKQVGEINVARTGLQRQVEAYVQCAYDFHLPQDSQLFLMHGLSGSGKSTVSSLLLKDLGAIRIRSDAERKRIPALTTNGPGEEKDSMDLYSHTMTTATYARLRQLAGSLLEEGYITIVDATFLMVDQRRSFQELATMRNVLFHIVHVDAPESLLIQRILERRQTEIDYSDATVEVLQKQQGMLEPFQDHERPSVISVDTTSEESLREGIHAVRTHSRKTST